jgi:hypothetical protein
VCIAFAGYSGRDVGAFATRFGGVALNGTYDPRTTGLVYSDLEQTKGYEFDTLIIANCREGVLPADDAPQEEQFRDTCKLYVAMTRAKRELILSFSGAASPWVRQVIGSIAVDRWESFETLDPTMIAGVPPVLPDVDPDQRVEGVGELTGAQYLFTSKALGLSLEAQAKLTDLVDGKGLLAAGSKARLRWRTVRSLAQDLRATRRHDQLFGPLVAQELRNKLI